MESWVDISISATTLRSVDGHGFVEGFVSNSVDRHQGLPRLDGSFLRIHSFPLTLFQSQNRNIRRTANADEAKFGSAAQELGGIHGCHFDYLIQ